MTTPVMPPVPPPAAYSGTGPATVDTSTGVNTGDLIALVGAVVVGISLFMSWYTITISATGMRDLERLLQGVSTSFFGRAFAGVGFGTGPETAGISALDHNAGGWRWAVLVVSAIMAVELFLTIMSATSSQRAPGWPHTSLLLVFAVTNLVLIVVAFFDPPLGGVPSNVVTSTPAIGAYIGLLGGLAVVAGAVVSVATSPRSPL